VRKKNIYRFYWKKNDLKYSKRERILENKSNHKKKKFNKKSSSNRERKRNQSWYKFVVTLQTFCLFLEKKLMLIKKKWKYERY
jgi:ATP-dependent Zn protease